MCWLCRHSFLQSYKFCQIPSWHCTSPLHRMQSRKALCAKCHTVPLSIYYSICQVICIGSYFSLRMVYTHSSVSCVVCMCMCTSFGIGHFFRYQYCLQLQMCVRTGSFLCIGYQLWTHGHRARSHRLLPGGWSTSSRRAESYSLSR